MRFLRIARIKQSVLMVLFTVLLFDMAAALSLRKQLQGIFRFFLDDPIARARKLWPGNYHEYNSQDGFDISPNSPRV